MNRTESFAADLRLQSGASVWGAARKENLAVSWHRQISEDSEEITVDFGNPNLILGKAVLSALASAP
jgi:hypothetical protein